jgi:hypothetical protein
VDAAAGSRVENFAAGLPLTMDEARQAMPAEHPLGHVGDPDDIGWGIVYLASDESKFIYRK